MGETFKFKASAVEIALPDDMFVSSVAPFPQAGLCGMYAPLAVGTQCGRVLLLEAYSALPSVKLPSTAASARFPGSFHDADDYDEEHDEEDAGVLTDFSDRSQFINFRENSCQRKACRKRLVASDVKCGCGRRFCPEHRDVLKGHRCRCWYPSCTGLISSARSCHCGCHFCNKHQSPEEHDCPVGGTLFMEVDKFHTKSTLDSRSMVYVLKTVDTIWDEYSPGEWNAVPCLQLARVRDFHPKSEDSSIVSLTVLHGLGMSLAIGSQSGSCIILSPRLDYSQFFLEEALPFPGSENVSAYTIEGSGAISHIAFHALEDDERKGFLWIGRDKVVSVHELKYAHDSASRVKIDDVTLRDDLELDDESQDMSLVNICAVSDSHPNEIAWKTNFSCLVWLDRSQGSFVVDIVDLATLAKERYAVVLDGPARQISCAGANIASQSVELLMSGSFTDSLGLGSLPVIDDILSFEFPQFDVYIAYQSEEATGPASARLPVKRKNSALACLTTLTQSGTSWLLPHKDSKTDRWMTLERAFKAACRAGLVPALDDSSEEDVALLQMTLALAKLAFVYDPLTPSLCHVLTQRDETGFVFRDEISLLALFEWTWDEGILPVVPLLRKIYSEIGLCGNTDAEDRTFGSSFATLAPISILCPPVEGQTDKSQRTSLGAARMQSIFSRLALIHTVLTSFRVRPEVSGLTERLEERLRAIAVTAQILELAIWLTQRNVLDPTAMFDVLASPELAEFVQERRLVSLQREKSGLDVHSGLLIDRIVAAAAGDDVELVFRSPGGSAAKGLYPFSASQLLHLVSLARSDAERGPRRSVAAYSVVAYTLLDLCRVRGDVVESESLLTEFIDCFTFVTRRDAMTILACNEADAARTDDAWRKASLRFQLAFDLRADGVSEVVAGAITRHDAAAALIVGGCASSALLVLGEIRAQASQASFQEVYLYFNALLESGRLLDATSLARDLYRRVPSCTKCDEALCGCHREDKERRRVERVGRICDRLFDCAVFRTETRPSDSVRQLPLGELKSELKKWLQRQSPSETPDRRQVKLEVLWELAINEGDFSLARAYHTELSRSDSETESFERRRAIMHASDLTIDQRRSAEGSPLGSAKQLRHLAQERILNGGSPVPSPRNPKRSVVLPIATLFDGVKGRSGVVVPDSEGIEASASKSTAAPPPSLKRDGKPEKKRSRVHFDAASFKEHSRLD